MRTRSPGGVARQLSIDPRRALISRISFFMSEVSARSARRCSSILNLTFRQSFAPRYHKFINNNNLLA